MLRHIEQSVISSVIHYLMSNPSKRTFLTFESHKRFNCNFPFQYKCVITLTTHRIWKNLSSRRCHFDCASDFQHKSKGESLKTSWMGRGYLILRILLFVGRKVCKPGETEFYDLWLVLVKWVKMFGIEIKYVILSSKGNLELLTSLVQIFYLFLTFGTFFWYSKRLAVKHVALSHYLYFTLFITSNEF